MLVSILMLLFIIVSSFFISRRVYKYLVKKNNYYTNYWTVLTFIGSFIVIWLSIVFIGLSLGVFGR